MTHRRLGCLMFLISLGASRISAQEVPIAVEHAPASALHQSVSASSTALTLADCYALALKRSETIAIQREIIKETEGRFLQALSGVLPRVSFALTEKRQDGSGGSAFTLREVPEYKFVFSQPLFAGFKEFAAMAASRAERRERINERMRAEHLLFLDVVNGFSFLLQEREDLRALETIRLAILERLDELRERERLGRTRLSEVASAETQLRRVEADLEDVQSQETTARQLLEFLTGREPIEAITDTDSSTPPVEEEAAYLAKATTRPDVRAAEEAWHVAQRGVNIAQAKFWPTVGVDGNYYTKRAGASKDVTWDVALKVDAPLFQGGQTIGAVREASSKAREAKLRYEQLQRLASLEIRDAYVELQAACRRSAALERALKAAATSYQLQVQDYRLNLVNNLDVLQALQALQDVHREVIQAQAQLTQRYWHLQVAVGETL